MINTFPFLPLQQQWQSIVMLKSVCEGVLILNPLMLLAYLLRYCQSQFPSSCLQVTNFFLFIYSLFVSILLSILASMFIKEIWPIFFFVNLYVVCISGCAKMVWLFVVIVVGRLLMTACFYFLRDYISI